MAADVVPAVGPVGSAARDQAGMRRAATLVGGGMLAMNALAYALTVLAAHALGPIDFGGFGALLGVVIVANVGSLTLQATGARRLATSTADVVTTVRRDLLRTGRALSVAVGLLLLACVPVLDRLLRIDDWVTTAMVAVACAALTMMGAYAGIMQGQRRWSGLGTIYLSMGVGRFVAGGVALLVDASTRSAMVGVAIGSLLPLVVGWRLGSAAGGAQGAAAGSVNPVEAGQQPMLAELWRNGHTLLAFFAFTNLDILLARHLFSHHDAGIYAGGAIITKACLFLPTFVLVVAFPSMATDRASRAWLKPMLVVLGLGGCAILGTLLLPGLAKAFAGGSQYAGLGGIAWVFALEGTLFAALQILVYDAIARQSRAAWVLWLGVVGLAVVAALFVHTVAALAGVAAVTALAVGVGICLLTRTRSTHPPVRPAAPR